MNVAIYYRRILMILFLIIVRMSLQKHINSRLIISNQILFNQSNLKYN